MEPQVDGPPTVMLAVDLKEAGFADSTLYGNMQLTDADVTVIFPGKSPARHAVAMAAVIFMILSACF